MGACQTALVMVPRLGARRIGNASSVPRICASKRTRLSLPTYKARTALVRNFCPFAPRRSKIGADPLRNGELEPQTGDFEA